MSERDPGNSPPPYPGHTPPRVYPRMGYQIRRSVSGLAPEREAVVAEVLAKIDNANFNEPVVAMVYRERASAVLAALNAAAALAQDGADPADGLSHAEKELLRPILARYARWFGAHDGPVFEAVERIFAARQRPTQQAATDRVVECVKCGAALAFDHESSLWQHPVWPPDGHEPTPAAITTYGDVTFTPEPNQEEDTSP